MAYTQSEFGSSVASFLGSNSGILGVGSSVLSGILNNAQSNLAYQRQLGLQNAQNEYNTRMWQMNNSYNSPSAQVGRLINAGINPATQFGNGQLVGNSSTAPSSGSAPSVKSPEFNMNGSAFFEQASLNNQTKVAESQVEANEERAKLNQTQREVLEKKVDSEIKLLEEKANLTRNQAENVVTQTRQINLNMDVIHDTYEAKLNQINSQAELNKIQYDLTKAQIGEIVTRIKNIVSDTSLKESQKSFVISQIALNEDTLRNLRPLEKAGMTASITKTQKDALLSEANAELTRIKSDTAVIDSASGVINSIARVIDAFVPF